PSPLAALLLLCHAHRPHPLSFPTRRSSDLGDEDFSGGDLQRLVGRPLDGDRDVIGGMTLKVKGPAIDAARRRIHVDPITIPWREDRKSTRLNSSHVKNSYAVFCLKKKRHLN